MRQRLFRLTIVALTLLVGITHTHARTPQVTAMTFGGWVQVRTAPDQRTTVITVIPGGIQTSAIGVVSVAFRLQHAPRALAQYAGPATVFYSRTRLTVAVTGRMGWTFVVAPGDSLAAVDDSGYPETNLAGLAFFWGSLVHDTTDAVFERLALGACAAGGGGNCTGCDAGGPDDLHCGASCGEGECQTTCGAGFHACCQCPLSCACCPNING